MRWAHFKILILWVLLNSCSGVEVDFARSLAVPQPADIVLRNGKIITVDRDFSIKEAVAIKDGRFLAVGSERDIRLLTGPRTRVVDLGGRTVIPGLIDSHIHATAAGITWDNELRWEQTRSLADGLTLIASAVSRRPAGQWIVVGGGWDPIQFAERRFPKREELDAIAPNHPVYLQYLGHGALLNSAALTAAGITVKTIEPAGGKFERGPSGELTGWLQGLSAWQYAYNKIPRPSLERVRRSLGHCFQELNRVGLTSVADLHTAGVSFAHRRILADMAQRGELTLRLNYYVAPPGGGDESEQWRSAVAQIEQLPQSDQFRFIGFGATLLRGAGELLSNPDGIAIDTEAKEKLRRELRFFAQGDYRFQLHATHDDTARQLLDVVEQVHAVTPFKPQRVTFAHLESASAETIGRVEKLGGGIAVQDRLALAGERYMNLSGEAKARNAPPLRTMLDAGVSVGAGTDAFRSGNYSPMLSLWWLVTGKTMAGSALRAQSQNLTRAEALRIYTMGSAWIIGEQRRRGSIETDKLADLVVLNADYLSVPADQIPTLESLLTMVGGRVVYFAKPFGPIDIYRR